MREAEPARNLLRRGGRGRAPEHREQRDRATHPDDERHDEPTPTVELEVDCIVERPAPRTKTSDREARRDQVHEVLPALDRATEHEEPRLAVVRDEGDG